MSKGTDLVGRALGYFFKPAASLVGTGAVLGTGAYFGVPAVFNAAVAKAAETFGIDPKLALPAVATAGAGLIGGLLGNGKIAGLAMAVTGVGFALNHISKNGFPGANLTADNTASLDAPATP